MMASSCDEDFQHGIEAVFVSEVPGYLNCAVCRLVLRNPLQISRCGHKFCTPCFNKLKTSSYNHNTQLVCPIDRKTIDLSTVFEDKSMSMIVGGLHVKCSFCDKGCVWVGELSNLVSHKTECEYNATGKAEVAVMDRDEIESSFRGMEVRMHRCEEDLKDKDKDIAQLKHNLQQMQSELSKKTMQLSRLEEKNKSLEEEIKLSHQKKQQSVNHLEVLYMPPCGHPVKVTMLQLEYYLKHEYEKNTPMFRCHIMVDVRLPRCGHEAKVSCNKATHLATWKGEPSDIGVVREGKKYGPADQKCNTRVTFERKCGHLMEMNCQDAFDQAEDPSYCNEQVSIINPECGHTANIPCHQAQHLNTEGQLQPKLPVDRVFEGKSKSEFGAPMPLVQCLHKVVYVRKCGHKINTKCCEARDESVNLCIVNVTVQNPLCEHDVELPCHLSAFSGWAPWGINSCPLQRGVLDENHAPPIAPPYNMREYVVKCKETIEVQRSICKHKYHGKCGEVMGGLGKPNKTLCVENVTVQNPLCEHDIEVPCHLSALNGWEPWGISCPLQGGVLDENHPPPIAPPHDVRKYVAKCKETIEVQCGDCSHKYQGKCSEVMGVLGKPNTWECKEILADFKLTCGHIKNFTCWQYKEYMKNPDKDICTEEVYVTCWNHGNCKNILKTTCNCTGEVMKCKDKSDWRCPNNHVIINVPLCERGIPSDCGECVLVQIRDHIKTLNQIKNDEKTIVLPSLPTELSQFQPRKIYTNETVKHFMTSQFTVLHGLEAWSRKQDPLRRSLFSYSLVPCFRSGYEMSELRSKDFKAYMQTSTLSGTQVCEWTVNNIERLIVETHRRQASEVCLLFGVVFCCRVLVDPPDYPGKGKKPYQKANWVKEKRCTERYFCVQHNQNQWDHLVVWDPYPMIATHEIWLTLPNLQQLVSQLKAAPAPLKRSSLLKPQFIQLTIPDEAKSHIIDGIEAVGEAEVQEEKGNEMK